MYFPLKLGDIPASYISLPEGMGDIFTKDPKDPKDAAIFNLMLPWYLGSKFKQNDILKTMCVGPRLGYKVLPEGHALRDPGGS